MSTKLSNISGKSNELLSGIEQLILATTRKVAVSLNIEISQLYWAIGKPVG